MKKTEKKLSRYWDEVVSSKLPSYRDFRKMEKEISEHFNFVRWAFKSIVIPLIVFYVVIGLVLNMNVFGSLFVSLLAFIYSNFLPDIDFLIKKTKNKHKESLWFEKYALLFFTPVILYYIIAGRAKPLYSAEERCFHNPKSLVIYGIFLFVIGSIFWADAIKRVMLPVFGMLGYAFHLAVDRGFKTSSRKSTPPSPKP